MENLSYSSYPDSGNSSPRSREIDENQSWEEPPPPLSNNNYKVRFMCSYGGKIQPRPHDNMLSYIGGETKILAVDRNIKFSFMLNKLSSLCGDNDICFKYQLPGEDLDALISVTNDEDLDHMMHEYDRLFRVSPKPARLRLFLFKLNSNNSSSGLRSNAEGKSDGQWFVDALNSVQVNNLDEASPPVGEAAVANPDFLFGLDKGFPVVPVAKFSETTTMVTPAAPTIAEVVGKDGVLEVHLLNQQIQNLQRMKINKTEETNIKGLEKGSDKFTQSSTQIAFPVQLPIPAYMQENQLVSSGYPVTGVGHDQQPIYFIPMAAAASVYPTPSLRPVTGQVGQGYYPVQRMVQDVYREQQPPPYNPMPPPPTMVQQQLPPKATVYSEGIPIVQQSNEQQGYIQVGYDGAGRQVFYTSPYQAVTSAPVAAVEGIQGGSPLSQEGKVVGSNVSAKPPQTSST